MTYQLTIDEFIGRWSYSKQWVRGVLASYKGKPVNVKISSLGGDLDHGLDIRQQFVDHGDVTVYLSGFVASAATVIAMGAKRVVMSKYAMFLVHKCSNFIDAWGSYNADEMQQLIDELEANKKENDKIDVVLANMYAARCKRKVSEILDILKEGRWLTADEALAFGFIDEIAEPASGEVRQNCSSAIRAKFNALGISTLGLEPTSAEDDSTPSGGLIRRIVDATVRRLQSLSGVSSDSEPIVSNHDSTPAKSPMPISRITALLGADSIKTDAEGSATLTAEQLSAIETRLGKSADELAAANTRIEALNTQIEALSQAPGDDTSDILDDGSESIAINSASLFSSIKTCL